MFARHDGRLLVGSLSWLVMMAVAATSCGKRYDGDDDDGGESGANAAGDGNSGSSTGGKGSGAAGSGATGSGATGSGATGSGATGSGATGSGGTPNAGGVGGTPSTGGDGSGATGGDVTSSGGSSNAGAAGECSGADCVPCTGDACPICGNLMLEGDEACDDGNTDDGDGCSSKCNVESSDPCNATECDADGKCVVRLPAIFRDFNGHAVSGGHPDFQPGYSSAGAVQGLVEALLDTDGKPVQTTTLSTTVLETNAYMHGQAAFAQWYRDDPPASKPIPGEIVLWDDGAGGYVNRWGANGEQWIGYPTLGYTYCATDCASCGTPGPGQVCLEQCTPIVSSATWACIIDQQKYDGNPLFFPIDASPGIPTDSRTEGKVPEQYGWAGWPWETDVAPSLGISTPIATATAEFPSATHNFSFTTEIKFSFRYDSTKSHKLRFKGDDDVWVFVNGHLAVDLGGWHVPLDATLTIEGGVVTAVTSTTTSTIATPVTTIGSTTTYELEDGKVYEIAMFHAERQVEGSSFMLGLSGLDVSRSTCTK